MKVVESLTLNGNTNPAVMAKRLRDLADLLDTKVLDMVELGSNPPSIPNGNNIVLSFPMEATV